VGDLLPGHATPRARLRELLAGPAPVVAPGSYDALSARLVEQAGFPVVYMSGFASTASLIGRPDVGLLGGAEMIDNARRIVAAVDVPVVADADTGYGNAINVVRTVREYEQAGVAGIHLEDQVMPKKCGHMSGKAVIGADEMAGKIRAAVAARRDPDLVLIARTDAAAVEGLDAAIARARTYAHAGADVLFVEAPESEREVELVADAFPGTPLLFNGVEGGRTPSLELDRLRELGFRIVLFPLTALFAATRAVQEALAAIRAHPTPGGEGALPFSAFTDVVGLPAVQELEDRFGRSVPGSHV
jgi:2,3-dimethylmalate lyase